MNKRIFSILTNPPMEELIPSKEMRDYLSSISHSFSDKETATLVWCSDLSLYDKNNLLTFISLGTTDIELKKQIDERISYNISAIGKFSRNTGEYIYALNILDPEIVPEDNIIGYYADVKYAETIGIKAGFPFKIIKHQIIREGVDLISARDFYSNKIIERLPAQEGISSVKYDKKGNPISYMTYELSKEEDEQVCELRTDRFEMSYVSIPHPFNKGDKVRYIGEVSKKEIVEGTVLSSQEDWKEIDEKAKNSDFLIDIIDASITVMFGTDPLFDHEHINPIFLEHVGYAGGVSDN